MTFLVMTFFLLVALVGFIGWSQFGQIGRNDFVRPVYHIIIPSDHGTLYCDSRLITFLRTFIAICVKCQLLHKHSLQ